MDEETRTFKHIVEEVFLNNESSTKLDEHELVEFLHELKHSNKPTNSIMSSFSQLNQGLNMEDLSNQTFTHIIGWLKRQEEKKQTPSAESIDINQVRRMQNYNM